MAKSKQAVTETVQCFHCPKVFDNIKDLKEHMAAEHGVVTATNTPQNVVQQEATIAAPANWPVGIPFPGAPGGGPGGGVAPPIKVNYINFQSLAQFNYRLEAMVKAVSPLKATNFGQGYDMLLDNGWTVTVKLNSQNHMDLYSAFGPTWTARRVRISVGVTERNSARIQVTPLVDAASATA